MIRFEREDGQFSSFLKCYFSGRWDAVNCLENEKEIEEQTLNPDVTKIVFDLEQVEYISSAFLRICIKTAKARQDNFSIVNVKPEVMKVFKISNFDSIMNIK